MSRRGQLANAACRHRPVIAWIALATAFTLQPGSSRLLHAQSTANGWRLLGPTNVGGPVTGISIDPADPNVLIVATSAGGLWRSANGGASWQPIDESLPMNVLSLARNPVRPNVLYAGFTSGPLQLTGGLLQSTDRGTTWSRVRLRYLPAGYSQPLDYTGRIGRVTVSADGSVVIADFLRSTDDGATWTAVAGIHYGPTFSPGRGQLGIRFTYPSSDARCTPERTANGFASFEPPSAVQPALPVGACAWSAVAFGTNDPNVVYFSQVPTSSEQATIYRSTDAGASFIAVGSVPFRADTTWSLWAQSLWVDPSNNQIVLYGSQDLWRSLDGGATFTRITDWSRAPALPGTNPAVIVADPGFNGTTNRRVYVGTDFGLFRTDDIYGATATSGWTPLNNGLVVSSIESVAVAAGGALLAVTDTKEALRLAADGAASTRSPANEEPRSAGSGLPFHSVRELRADPLNPSFVWVVDVPYNYDQTAPRLMRSADTGATFSSVALPSTSTTVRLSFALTDPLDGNRLYLFYPDFGPESLIFRTTSARNSAPAWERVQPASPASMAFGHDGAFAPGNPSVLWLSGGSYSPGVRSTNADAASPTFTNMGPPGERIERLTIATADGQIGYVEAFRQFIRYRIYSFWRTADGGATWTLMTHPVSPAGLTVNFLTTYPGNPDWVFAATDRGVYHSTNRGLSWTLESTRTPVSHLAWRGTTLIAATRGQGLWAWTVPGQPAIVIDAPVSGTTARRPITLAGWALDAGHGSTSGVDAVHVYAYPNPGSGTPPIFLGAATYGGARPDVGALYGPRFEPSGFSLTIGGLTAGVYQIVAFAHSTFDGRFTAAAVTVRIEADPHLFVDVPAPNATLRQPFHVGGWALDLASATGPGVDAVHVWAYPQAGGSPTFVGAATLGGSRPDVGLLFGSRFDSAGFNLRATGLLPGPYSLVVFARSTVSRGFDARAVPITVRDGVDVVIDRPSPGERITLPYGLGGWAVDSGASTGPGIDAVHVWAYPVGGGPAVFVGSAAYGFNRPDVAAIFGAAFTPSGYNLSLANLSPGTYDLAVFARSTLLQTFAPARVVRVTIQ